MSILAVVGILVFGLGFWILMAALSLSADNVFDISERRFGLFVALVLVVSGGYLIYQAVGAGDLFPAYSVTCYEDGEIVFQDRETQVYPEIREYAGGCLIVPLRGE